MNINSMIAEIRYHLNDIEGLGFPDALLTEFIEDGLCMLYSLKPEDFTVRRVHHATVGSVQCVDDCCDKLISVDAKSDACGNILDGIKSSRMKPPRQFGKKSIPHAVGQYSVYLRDNDNNSFDVAPPIKAGEAVYFLITCAENPSIDDDGNIPDCPHHQALLHYVLYRANNMETESQSSIAIARSEYAYFFELLNIKRKLDKEAKEDAASE